MFFKFKVYFTERFPLIPLLLYTTATILSINSTFYSIDWKRTLVLSLIYLMFLFHLRILDEFKDYNYDSKHHADRPVQKGWITLDTLQKIGVLNFLLIFFFALSISNLKQLSLLIFALIYTGFMFKEFFFSEYLRKHVILYLISHELVFVPLFLFFFSTFRQEIWIPNTLARLNLLFYIILPLLLIEIGRKIKHRYNKGKKTNDTYAYIWGQENSLRVFSFIIVFMGVLSIYIPGFNKLLSGTILFFSILIFAGSFINPKYLIEKSRLITTVCALLLPLALLYSYL